MLTQRFSWHWAVQLSFIIIPKQFIMYILVNSLLWFLETKLLFIVDVSDCVLLVMSGGKGDTFLKEIQQEFSHLQILILFTGQGDTLLARLCVHGGLVHIVLSAKWNDISSFFSLINWSSIVSFISNKNKAHELLTNNR